MQHLHYSFALCKWFLKSILFLSLKKMAILFKRFAFLKWEMSSAISECLLWASSGAKTLRINTVGGIGTISEHFYMNIILKKKVLRNFGTNLQPNFPSALTRRQNQRGELEHKFLPAFLWRQKASYLIDFLFPCHLNIGTWK